METRQFPVQDSASVLTSRSAGKGAAVWIADHPGVGVALIVFAAFLVRIWLASGTFLNPDEALHFLIANHNSWHDAYRTSLYSAHPPLLIFVLYFWRLLGTSELVLRLPSVLAGTAFCWVLYRWLKIRFGPIAALSGLILVAFLPPLVILSAEVRQYELMLLFLVLGALLLEQGFASNSKLRILLSALCLGLAILFQYSALLFTAAIGIYALVRLWAERPPRSLVSAWVAGNLGLAALFVFLYLTHISHLKATSATAPIEGWLRNSFYHPGHDNLLVFFLARTFGVFQFTFGQLAIGDVACLAFVVAIILLINKRIRSAKQSPDSRALALLLISPFVLNFLAATVGLYPYGGTRHSAFLVIFAVAGVSVFLAWSTKQRMFTAAAIALGIVLLCAVFSQPHRPYMLRADQSRVHMLQAKNFIEQEIPAADVILADYETSLELTYYLCGPHPFTPDLSIPGFTSAYCGGHTVIMTMPETNVFTPTNFLQTWNAMQRAYRPKLGDSVWIVQAGWDTDLFTQLRAYSEFQHLKAQSFGSNIKLFKINVRQPLPTALN